MRKIVFTGGGTAGHVTPNLALIEQLRDKGWSVDYIGSYQGIEKQIVENLQIRYHPISSGKLRRYFDLQNFKDPFKVIRGLWDALRVLRRIRPDLVFSKGGFVAVPVVIAARWLRIPVIIHESDMTPGLANKLSIPFATRVCVTFPETLKHISGEKAVQTGVPIRSELLQGDAREGRKLCDFTEQKPVLLMMGGSLGAQKINVALRERLDDYVNRFQIIHICGKGHAAEEYRDVPGYRQFEYVHEELPHMLAAADLVISRAGATSIFELLALRKPMLLIPLSRQASRGDQILNAQSFERSGFCRVLQEEEMSGDTLYASTLELYQDRQRYADNMRHSDAANGAARIVNLIEQLASAQ